MQPQRAVAAVIQQLLANKGWTTIPPGGEQQRQCSELWRKQEVRFTRS